MSGSKEIENAIEAALFSSERPLDARDLQTLFSQKVDKKDIQSALETLQSHYSCLLYTSPSPRDGLLSRMPSSA